MRNRVISLKGLSVLAIAAVCAFAGSRANANATVTVDPGQTWIGYMNWFELDGTTYDSGSVWAATDLPGSFTGAVATIGPNTSIDAGNPSDPYWWQNGGTGAGNHIMAASFYVQSGGPGPSPLAGQTITFTGNVLSNTLVSPYTSVAFIDDFTTSYSLVNTVSAPLTPGVFSISLNINPGDILQYGFITTGPNARVADAPSLGSVQITAVPEPASLGILAIGGLLALRRRRA